MAYSTSLTYDRVRYLPGIDLVNLKQRLQDGEHISAPGVFDPFSAKVAESLSFPVLYMTGYGVNASLFGLPDAAFASFGDMVDRVRAITEVTEASLIADGDTGFGGLPNVERAVAGYEAAGAEAIQIEDQEFPKRCGHTKNRSVIPTGDMVKKIVVASETRASEDFLIIARTDARTGHGIDEALSRADTYLEAGADVLFVESPETETEMQKICEAFAGVPLLANMVGGGSTPVLPDAELFALGYQIVIHPIYLLGAAMAGMHAAAAMLRQDGRQMSTSGITELNELLDFQRIWQMDDRFND